MLRKLVKPLLIVAIGLLITSTITMAWPVTVTQQVKVVYRQIRLFVDGKEVNTDVQPFLLQGQGTAMVPVRALAKALGKPVSWDNINGVIIIGKKPDNLAASGFVTINTTPVVTKPSIVKKATQMEDMQVLRNIGPFYRQQNTNLSIAGKAFANGVAVELSNGKKAEVIIDLNQKFHSLEGFFGVEDQTRNSKGGFTLTIYGDETEIYKSPVIKPAEYPRYINQNIIGNITRHHRLKFAVEWADPQILGDSEKVIASLANFKFFK